MTPLSVCLALMIGLCQGRIWQIPLPKPIQDCYNKVQYEDIQTFVGSTFSWQCESTVLDSHVNTSVPPDAQRISYYKHLLESVVADLPGNTYGTNVPGRRRQARRRCVRREYRVLSDEDRRRFHNAVNALKRDTTVRPNKYDAIALLHEAGVNIGHSGAGFAGWHRIYLLMFESALREVDSSVCLPYWDTTLDNELEDPTQSSVWTPAFFGTPNGPVLQGPFANWTTPKGAQLIRNVGADGELLSATNMEDILSRRRYVDITSWPEVQRRYDLEYHHGGIHVFCGGGLSQLDTAAFDPVFFLIHAYVDFIWELFRTNLRANGVDPEIYPDIVTPDSPHHSSAPTGFGDLLQVDGYRNAIAQTFEYQLPPVCSSRSPQCGSRYLICKADIGRCVPIDAATAVSLPADLAISPVSIDIQPSGRAGANTRCLRQENFNKHAIQNDYCCDNTCDSNEWVMIPVGIISVRPPDFIEYHSYPVHNGRVDRRDDIYSPRAHALTNRFITQRLSKPKTYARCKGNDTVGVVLVSSRGINYHGFYEEEAIVDHRLAVSMTMGFVAVKKPTRAEVSKVLIRAHDSCGRVCQAACKDELTGQYKKCKGAIAISSDQPLMYGTTYDEVVLNMFNYELNNDLPQFRSNNVFMTFHCDYHSNFPYTDYINGVVPQPAVAVKPPAVVPPPSTECVVTPQCVLDIPCASVDRQCKLYNEMHVCRGSCQAYAVCMYGRFFLQACPEGQSFDNVLKICLPGGCQNNQTHTYSIGGSPNRDASGSNVLTRASNLLSSLVNKIVG